MEGCTRSLVEGNKEKVRLIVLLAIPVEISGDRKVQGGGVLDKRHRAPGSTIGGNTNRHVRYHLSFRGYVICAIFCMIIIMARFTAILVGESDGHTARREFPDRGRAIGWLQGGGLVEFTDQSALGEVTAEDGSVVWRKSNLRASEQAEREKQLDAQRLLASLNLYPKARR